MYSMLIETIKPEKDISKGAEWQTRKQQFTFLRIEF